MRCPTCGAVYAQQAACGGISSLIGQVFGQPIVTPVGTLFDPVAARHAIFARLQNAARSMILLHVIYPNESGYTRTRRRDEWACGRRSGLAC